ncbi:MAG: cyclic nucleotide-binding domain-containing protein [Verrucomicrobiota bacterium]
MNLDWLSTLPVREYSSGEEIIRQETCLKELYFLRTGQVEVTKGDTRVTLIKTPGSVLGEISLMLNIDTTATVRAATSASCFVASNPFEFLKSNPEVHMQVSRALAFRLNAATTYLVDVKDQLKDCSDHVGMVDGVIDALVHRDLKKKVPV